MALLGDSDEKTRANACGALGNLLRNGSTLSQLLIEAGAPETLLQALQKDVAAVKKTALFALGNFCSVDSVRARLLQLGFADLLSRRSAELLSGIEDDPQLQKYIERIKQRLGIKQ